jgi:hypothetical protein
MHDLYKHLPFTHSHWLTRVRKSLLLAAFVVTISLTIGVLGYRYLGHFGWVDAFLEASMILGGMGPVAPLTNDAVKLFAAFYALFSGLVLISTTGLLLAPWVQRLFYHTHRQACDDIDSARAPKK